MAAPKGNKNGAKAKKWEEALRTALSRAGGSIELGLAPIADIVVSLAQSGDMDAIRELSCRLDGKPTEHVHIESEVTVSVGDSEHLGSGLEKALAKRTSAPLQ